MFLDNFSARGQKNTYKNQTIIQHWSKCAPAYTNDEGYIVTNSDTKYPYPCVTYGATMVEIKEAYSKNHS